MKSLITFALVLMGLTLNAQSVFDFSVNPLTSGWTYYDDYGSNPNPGFTYDSINRRIEYNINTGTEVSILHTSLSQTLSNNYCVSFKITPSNTSNYNTFFPLVLTPAELTGTDKHPWRLNADSSTVGGMQDLDFLAVEVLSNEIRLFARKGNDFSSNTIQSMSPSFYTAADSSYWIKLGVNNTMAILGIYSDAGLTTQIGSTIFTIPALSGMNHLYMANCNGNSTTTQRGYLDDYRIENCSVTGMNNIPQSIKKKELVKVIDMLGRETNLHSNEPLILIYKDGSMEKWMRVEAE